LEPGDLNAKIYRALDCSKSLVVICSTRTRESKYVDDEIRYFKRIGKANQIYTVIIEGEPSGPTSATGYFPESLRYEVDGEGNLLTSRQVEPLAADFRLADGSQGWTNLEAYRAELMEGDALSKAEVKHRLDSYQDQLEDSRLKLIASVLGVPFGILHDRDKAYQLTLAQRRAKVLRRWLSAVGLLALVALAAAWFANEQRKRAVERALIATSGKLSLAASSVQEQPDLALLLAAESYRNFDTYEARAALYSAITRRPNLKVIAHANRAAIVAISQSYDGKVVVSGHKDGSVLFWSADTLKSLGPALQAHSAPLVSVVFSPTTAVLATAAGDEVRFWDARTREPLTPRLRTGLGDVSMLAFSRDGKRVASAQAEGITIWEIASSPRIVNRLPESENSSSIAFSPDGKLVAAGDYGARVRVWDLADNGRLIGEPISTLQRYVSSVAFSPDNRVLAIGGSSPGISFWNPHTKRQVREPLVTASGRTVVTFDGSRGQVAAGDRAGMISLWSELSFLSPIVETLSGHRGPITALIFDQADGFVFSGGEDGKLIKWSTETTNPLARWVQDSTESIATSSRRDLFAVGRADGTITLWDSAGHFTRLIRVPGTRDRVGPIAFSHDDELMAAFSSDKLVVWRFKDDQLVSSLAHGDPERIAHFRFDRDKHLVLCTLDLRTDGDLVKVDLKLSTLDPATGRDVTQPLRIPIANQNPATALSDDGALLAIAMDDEVWFWRDGKEDVPSSRIKIGSEISALRFSGDRSRLAVGTPSGHTFVVDVSTKKTLAELYTGDPFRVNSLAFSPEGRVLASGGVIQLPSGGFQGVLFVWDLLASQPIGQLLRGRQSAPQWFELAFDASGRTLMTMGDGDVWAWDVSAQSWYMTALRIANRPLSGDERRRFLVNRLDLSNSFR
jgi:WD40 repeat protein